MLRNQAGAVEVIDVVGVDNDKDYGKPDGDRIRKEVIPVLRQRGIQPDQVTILFVLQPHELRSQAEHHFASQSVLWWWHTFEWYGLAM